MMYKRALRAGLILLVPWILSCSRQGKVNGTVVDEASTLLPGVKVQLENSTLETLTDENGAYSLPYVPGSFRVTFAKVGYIGGELALTLQGRENFPAQVVRLLRLPKEETIVAVTPQGYVQLQYAPVRRSTTRTGSFVNVKNHYSYRAEGTPAQIKAGECTFLDFDPGNQVLVRLSKGDEIARLVTLPFGLVESSNFDALQDQAVQVSDAGWKRVVTISPGRYAFVVFEKAGFSGQAPQDVCYFFEAMQ